MPSPGWRTGWNARTAGDLHQPRPSQQHQLCLAQTRLHARQPGRPQNAAAIVHGSDTDHPRHSRSADSPRYRQSLSAVAGPQSCAPEPPIGAGRASPKRISAAIQIGIICALAAACPGNRVRRLSGRWCHSYRHLAPTGRCPFGCLAAFPARLGPSGPDSAGISLPSQVALPSRVRRMATAV